MKKKALKEKLLEKINYCKSSEFRDFLQMDITQHHFWTRIFVVITRLFWIVIQGIKHDLVMLRASALTYITMVGLVPALAFIFAVAGGFGGSNMLKDFILENAASVPEAMKSVIPFILDAVSNINYQTIGGIGLLASMISTIFLLEKIEQCFNAIWGVKVNRTFLRKFSDYTSVLVLIPILVLASTTIQGLFLSDSFQAKLQVILGKAFFIVKYTTTFSSYLIIFIAFTLLYSWLPNTKVRFLPSFIGSIVAGLLWKLVFSIFIALQVGVTNASAIYGTFAALPILLSWLYTSWVILLIGAEVCFAVQNWNEYDLSLEDSQLNFKTTLALAFLIMQNLAKDFFVGEDFIAAKFSQRHRLDHRKVLKILNALENAKLIEKAQKDELIYLPKRDLEQITGDDIFASIAGDCSFSAQSFSPEEREKFEKFNNNWNKFVTSFDNSHFRNI